MHRRSFTSAFLALLFAAQRVWAFDMSRPDNLAVYWGQGNGLALSDICQDDTIDTIPLAFLSYYDGTTGSTSMRLEAGSCNMITECSGFADQIESCQQKGKIITISIGGGDGSITLSSDTEAETFGELIYDTFLGGNSSARPFGNAVLDGIDLDIEGGSTTHFPAFISHMLQYAQQKGDKKKYYVTAAPQCPYPDAYQQDVLNQAQFDAVYVQFYNNMPTCGLTTYPNNFNFETWHNWATNTSPNKDVKVYIGAPASDTAGHFSVSADTLETIAKETREKYSSFGGVMLWDAVEARNNSNFDQKIKNALMQDSGSASSSSTIGKSSSSQSTYTVSPTGIATASISQQTTWRSYTSANGGTAVPNSTSASRFTTVRVSASTSASASISSIPLSSPTSTPSIGQRVSCVCASAWTQGVAYEEGDEVIFNGHLFVAKWWVENNPPGSAAGAWKDEGSCSTSDGAAAAACATTETTGAPSASITS